LTDIRANTVLPARRRAVTLHTADGLRLTGHLALPPDGPPRATALFLHPLPTHGGSVDSHLLRKADWRLPALAGIAVVRFNTRGTADSEGTFTGGDAERYDVAAALDLTRALAREMGQHGITVNCVAPGPVDTDIMGGTLTDERKAAMSADILVGRVGTVRDIAALMVFLMGEDAGYITAATYDINGGLQIS
jgi:hypothetical protein